jgi:hypothetical protein
MARDRTHGQVALLRDIKDLWDAGVGELEMRPFDYAQGDRLGGMGAGELKMEN